MRIYSYQIRNVLNQYSEQLSAATIKAAPDDRQRPGLSDFLLTDGKRMEIIDRITTSIVEKISRLDVKEHASQIIRSTSGRNLAGSGQLSERDEKQFVFNSIDKNNQKVTTKIPVEDPGYLIKRFEKQVSEAVDNKPVRKF